MQSPFIGKSLQEFVAKKGLRGGYIQLATSQQITEYSALPPSLFLVALDWMRALEKLGAKRVYSIILSEEVRHIHIHLYPRWNDEEQRGLALFEERHKEDQPSWDDSLNQELINWAAKHGVGLI